MDRERVRLSAGIARRTWMGRVRTLLRAIAIATVTLGGFNLLLGPVGPSVLRIHREVILVFFPTPPVMYITDVIAIIAGLFGVLILSVWGPG